MSEEAVSTHRFTVGLQGPSSAPGVANAVSVDQPSDKDDDGDVGPMVDHSICLAAIEHEFQLYFRFTTMATYCTSI